MKHTAEKGFAFVPICRYIPTQDYTKSLVMTWPEGVDEGGWILQDLMRFN